MKKFSFWGLLMLLAILAIFSFGSAFGADYKFVTVGSQPTKDGIDGEVVGTTDSQSLSNKLYNVDLVALGVLKNGTTNGVLLIDDTPAGEWSAIDADVVVTADATIFKVGTTSLKMVVAVTADANDGVTNPLGGGDQDWTDDESVGIWIYTSKALVAGDLQLNIVDGAADHKVNIPAVSVINTWTWVEIDVSGVANANKDVITDLKIQLSAAGAVKAAAGAFSVYFDFMFKWDGADEVALGKNVAEGGVKAVLVVATAAASVNTMTKLVEYTDYIVNYQSGNDVLVFVTDQSAASGIGMVFYQ